MSSKLTEWLLPSSSPSTGTVVGQTGVAVVGAGYSWLSANLIVTVITGVYVTLQIIFLVLREYRHAQQREKGEPTSTTKAEL